MTEIPERLDWAVDLLDLRPGQRVLEIGGGNGQAASLILERIGTAGRLTFLERSATAIERASQRNRDALDSGRFLPVMTDVAGWDPNDARFDRVLAVNVNMFWTGDASREVGLICSTLQSKAQVLVAYETPSPAKLVEITEKVKASLFSGGLDTETHQLVERSLVAVRGVAKS